MTLIRSIDMSLAMTSESYAAQLIRSDNITPAQRGEIVAHWGADKVKIWESVDSTEYQISDEDYNSAKSNGRNAAAESVGYDGHKDHGAWKEAAGAAVTGTHAVLTVAGGCSGSALGQAVVGTSTEKGLGKLLSNGKGSASRKASDIITVLLASAVVAQYIVQKPNKEQYEAIMKLMESEYPQGRDSLQMAQENMQEATEETTDLTDEAQEKNDEANDAIEDDKTKMDFYRAQYEALIAKAHAAANGGEPLTPDEKKLLEKLAPLLVEIVGDIDETNEDASDELGELYDEIGEYQDRYDEGAETIAEVQGVTDFGEGFDESTRTMCYVEMGAQLLNATSAGIAAAKLYAKAGLTFGATTAFAIMGTLAAAASTNFAIGALAGGNGGFGTGKSQLTMANDISVAIDSREATQDMEDVTTEVYDEELDNFAGNLEVVDNMEIEIPEDLETPDANEASAALAGANNAEGSEGTGNPFIDAGTDDKKDDDKKTDII